MTSDMAPAGSHTPIVRLVDDDPVLLRSLALLLRRSGFWVDTYETAEAFLARRDGDAPGCVVLDLKMPSASGLDVQQMIAAGDNPLPVIFLTGHGDVPSSVRAMKNGAVDFLIKPAAAEEIISAIRHSIAVDEAAKTERRQLRQLQARFGVLTQRERQVFALVAQGLLNKQIAGKLGTSERTIKAHRANVMRKMKAASVAELVRAAERLADLAAPSGRD